MECRVSSVGGEDEEGYIGECGMNRDHRFVSTFPILSFLGLDRRRTARD